MTGSLWRVGTIRIGRVGSIAVDLHFTFIFVILWGAWQGWYQHGGLDGALYGVLVVVLLFVSIFIHELAHGLQARHFGLTVRRITLLPIGGLAELETPPAYPHQELLIALVGPLSNLVLALILGVVSYLIDPFTLSGWVDQALLQFFLPPSLNGLLTYMVGANGLLFLFNMIPAFPMDGGRVFRAGLAAIFNYRLATEVMAWSTVLMAVGFFVFGLIGWPPARIPPNPPLVVMAIMIGTGARQEQVSVRRQHALTRVEAGEIVTTRGDGVSPWDTIGGDLLTRLYRSNQTLPVLVENRLVGLLVYADAHRLARSRPSPTVAHVMRTEYPVLGQRDTLWVALREMSSGQLEALPVVEDDHYQGMVTLEDINHAWRFAVHRR